MDKGGERSLKAEIVEFADDHAAAFAKLNYEWIEKYFSIERHDREILEHPGSSVIEPGGQIFMAIVDGEPAGTVAMIPSGDGRFELTKMAVAPRFQGGGLGDRLIERCLDFARRRGATSVFLESHRSLGPALSLYRKHGFAETDRDPNSEYARADIRMSREL